MDRRGPADFDKRYALVERIGEGGMGSVHLAEDRVLGRQVAVKFLHAEAWGHEAVARFHEEARSLARLDHPNVLRILDTGGGRDAPWMVFEYVDGCDLGDFIDSFGALSWEQIRRWGDQFLDGMAFAHQQGILHRDLKSDNLLVGKDENLRISDFGLARRDDRRTALTSTGAVLGTPNYISPEQACGKPATAASDIYSAGVVLFEMVTGRLPFQGEDMGAMLQLHAAAIPPDPRSLRADCCDALAELLLRALAKEPEERPSDFRRFRRALGQAFGEAPVDEDPMATVCLSRRARQGERASKSRAPSQRGGPSGANPSVSIVGSGAWVASIPPWRWGVFFFCLTAALLALVAGLAHRSPVPVLSETVWEGLVVKAGLREAELRWKTLAPRRFTLRVFGKGKELFLRPEERACETHRMVVRGLSPGAAYELELKDEHGGHRFPLETRSMKLDRRPMAFAHGGALWFDFAANAKEGLSLDIRNETHPEGVETRHLPAEGPLLLKGIAGQPADGLRWTLRFDDSVLARGRCPCSVGSHGAILAPLARGPLHPSHHGPSTDPLWFGDRFAFVDGSQIVRCFEVLRGDEERTLRLAWAWALPVNHARASRLVALGSSIAALAEDRLFVQSRDEGGSLHSWCLRVDRRAERWSERVSDPWPERLPEWIDDPADPWTAIDPQGEWTEAYPVPRTHESGRGICAVDDRAVVSVHCSQYLPKKTEQKEEGHYRIAFSAFDRGTGRRLWTRSIGLAEMNRAPLFEGRGAAGRWSETPEESLRPWSQNGDCLIVGAHVVTMIRRGVDSERRMERYALLETSLDGRAAMRVVCRWNSFARRIRPVLVEGRVCFSGMDRVFSWTPGEKKARTSPPLPETPPFTRYVSCPPVKGEEDCYLLLFQQGDRQVGSAVTKLIARRTLARAVLTSCSGKEPERARWQLWDPPTFSDHAERPPCIGRLERHGGLIIGQSTHTLFAFDERHGRFGWLFTNQIDRLTSFSYGPGGMAAAVTVNGGIYLVPGELILGNPSVRLTKRPDSP